MTSRQGRHAVVATTIENNIYWSSVNLVFKMSLASSAVSEASFHHILVPVKVCDILFKIADGTGGKRPVVDGT